MISNNETENQSLSVTKFEIYLVNYKDRVNGMVSGVITI